MKFVIGEYLRLCLILLSSRATGSGNDGEGGWADAWSGPSWGRMRWTHSAWLGESSRSPRLYWNPQEKAVEFKVEANTIGGIVLGFDDEDFVVLWVDDVTGKAHVEDYHFGNSSRILFRDAKDSYQLIGGHQNATHTQIAFGRLWDTCDANDSVLGPDTVLINWSIHPNDEIDKDLSDQSPAPSDATAGAFRGEKYLLLQAPAQPEIPRGHHIHQWDVLMRNVVINNKTSTQYWCKVFRTPPLPKKSHIIAYEPMILSNLTSLVHHMFLYECAAPPGYLDSYAPPNQNGYPCYTEDMPSDWEKCITPVAVWVVGGGRKVLPEHVGLPIGPRQTYFMLEIHYKDPGVAPVIDNSGFRLHYTEDLRPFDAGVMTTGVKVTPLHLVPPEQTEYRSTGLCNDVCTNKVLPLMGVKVVSVLLHSHIPAVSMKLRHVRGDVEMDPIAENNKYKYEDQMDQRLKEEVTIFPTDHLITECDHTTLDKKAPTFGSRFSREEMCSSFVTYYPRTNLASCHSMTPVRHFFKTLGIKSFFNATIDDIEKYVMKTSSSAKYKSSMVSLLGFFDPDAEAIAKLLKTFSEENSLLKLVISEPNEFKGRNLSRYIESLPWGDEIFSKSFESSLTKGFQIVLCRVRTNQLAIAPNIESFPKFTELPKAELKDCNIPNNLEGNFGSKTADVKSRRERSRASNSCFAYHSVTMADDLIDFSDGTEKPIDVQNRLYEIGDFPQTLVTEKIIFVIDIMLLANENKHEANIRSVWNLCKSYFNVKKKICVKPAKFECLLYNNNEVLSSVVESAKDLCTALIKISNFECEVETQPLKMEVVLDEIANLVELPDPECSRKGLPPNWVYHVVWLFSRNLHVPTMENTNSFDYLMMTPYFALDILYLYDKRMEGNECENISQALARLNENGQGYFLMASVTEKTKLLSCFTQFLGHPLMRVPQVKAKFNILELGIQLDSNDNAKE